MTTLFVSDVHLSGRRPEMVEAFVDFLAGPARQADGLYLLGDVFDEWLGDDDDRDPHPRVEAALQALSAAGCRVHVAHGNHDFLIGEAFCARTGARLLAGPAVHAVEGVPVLLMHGDELCTDDHEYQAFRAHVRNPQVQAQFLALPFEHRVAEAARLRGQSAAAVRLKAQDIMDVAPPTVAEQMSVSGVRHLVHGHTHRPAVHELEIGGETAWRIVLGDWYEQDSVLQWDGEGFRHRRIAELES